MSVAADPVHDQHDQQQDHDPGDARCAAIMAISWALFGWVRSGEPRSCRRRASARIYLTCPVHGTNILGICRLHYLVLRSRQSHVSCTACNSLANWRPVW